MNVTDAIDQLKTRYTLTEQHGDAPAATLAAINTTLAVLTPFAAAVATLDTDETLTPIGKAARRRTLTDPLIQNAERLDEEASAIERVTTTNAASVLAEELKSPVGDSFAAVVDTIQQIETVRRLESEDPLIRNLHVVELARRGGVRDMQIVRHALAAHAPAVTLKESKWQPLLDETTISAVKEAILERRSPQGPNARTAMELRGLAKQLRTVARGSQ